MSKPDAAEPSNSAAPGPAPAERSRRREQSARDFSAMLGHIQSLTYSAQRRGESPHTVYLGPKHQRILEAEMNWQDMEGRLVRTPANVDRLIQGDVDGVQLLGLTVRKSDYEGIGPVK